MALQLIGQWNLCGGAEPSRGRQDRGEQTGLPGRGTAGSAAGQRGAGGATGARTAATLGSGRHLLFVLFGWGVTNVRDVTS